MKRLFSIFAQELLRSLLLIAALVVALSVIEQFLFNQREAGDSFGEALARFVLEAHLDRNGRPLFEVLWQAAWITLPIVGLALCFLAGASVLAGVLFTLCRFGRVFRPLLALVSAVPSFLWPFLPYLMFPSLEFRGFATTTSVLWPALMLAAGDLNWLMVSTIYADALSSELSRPHTRTLQTLGGSMLLHVWPRSVMGLLEALAGRVPHLLGGTVALEILFNLKGLGYLAFHTIFSVPLDFSILLWVCGLGMLIGRGLVLLKRMLSALLFLETVLQPSRKKPSEKSEADTSNPRIAGSDTTAARHSENSSTPHTSPASLETDFESHSPLVFETAHAAQDPSEQTCANPVQNEAPFVTLRLWKIRIRYYLLQSRANWIKLATAVFLCMLAVVLAIWGWSHIPAPVPDEPLADNPMGAFRLPSENHPLGTNANDDDVLTILMAGLRQQTLPLCLAGLVSLFAVPLAVSDLIARLSQRRWLIWPVWLLKVVADLVMELIESIPKVILLLACFSFFSADGLILKMHIAIGVVLMPQLYRAVRDDAAVLKDDVFLNASRTAGISASRILVHNILKNHLLHVIAIQAALLVASIIHVDAVLGFLGVRNRSSIFTWGSVLGMGIEEFLQFRPLENVLAGFVFNDAVVWAPFVGVWLGILCAVMFADAIKVPLGGYVYRSK